MSFRNTMYVIPQRVIPQRSLDLFLFISIFFFINVMVIWSMQKNINFMKIELLFFLLSGKNDVLRCGMTQELSAKNQWAISRKNDYAISFFISVCYDC